VKDMLGGSLKHVEMDEAYVGGREIGGKRGRGTSNKTVVFGIKERGGRIRAAVVPDASLASLRNRLDRKRAQVSQRDLSEYLSMWANTQPSGGMVLIGVEKNGEISGCKGTEQEHINTLHTARRLCPDAVHEFKNVPLQNAKGDDDYIIVLRVHYRADKLVECTSGEAFIREGDEKRRLTESEKREIRLNKGELDLESERVNLSFPADFDEKLLAEYRADYIAKRELADRYSTEEILELSKLGKRTVRGFQPNMACALLFANDPRQIVPGAYIRIIRYFGSQEQFGRSQNITKEAVIEGPLPLQIAAAEEFVRGQIRNFTRLGRDGRFQTSPEYPEDAWLEAIVNAVVHRSYNLKHMNIFVKMFEDKLVIESPGGFLPPTTAETVFEAHNPRNPNLMWALYYFKRVQCAYEGTRRMRDEMRKANLPDPKFTQKQVGHHQVVVTLENDAEHRKIYVRAEAALGINPDIYANLSESEKMIVNYLADQDRVNVQDAGLVIAKDWRETKKTLVGLEKKGVIERSEGKSRSRHRFYYLRKRLKKPD